VRVAIGCDHRGLELKEPVVKLVAGAGHSYEDFGCYSDMWHRPRYEYRG